VTRPGPPPGCCLRPAGGYIGVAGLAAAVVALIAIGTSHPVWPPKILITCSLVLFAVPQAEWTSPVFKKINRVLSTAWGVAIFGVGAARVLAAAIDRRPAEILLGLVVPVGIITYGLKFSRSYPARVAHPPARAPAGHGSAS
jgi:hypothetical protein